jgi:hypothetical protein
MKDIEIDGRAVPKATTYQRETFIKEDCCPVVRLVAECCSRTRDNYEVSI